ncbi:P-loop containing nucleoside triphosphate hydrolase protein [Phyllosticta citriasiana]|uniref:P-loop containing nucleoside triphosphate hydrolase protein n=1 Tax=Phyllosticta citriasiana TaxID=595635 RepID=A0ABR1KVM3_9PEZI
MEDQVERLATKVWDKFHHLSRSQRLLIGVSGIPGSGKTTLAAKVASRLNELYHAQLPGASAGEPPVAGLVPMDGYHLSRAQLDAMPDPHMAHARRGAHFTFDAESFVRLIKELRKPLAPETRTLYAPSFDHAVKDPVQDDIAIAPTTRILLFEGNYLSLDRDPWRQAARLMDELWFVEVDFETARRRLVGRHVKAGIAKDEAEANKRVSENDLVNGKQIVEERVKVDEIIVSKEDPRWKPEEQGLEKEE